MARPAKCERLDFVVRRASERSGCPDQPPHSPFKLLEGMHYGDWPDHIAGFETDGARERSVR